MFNLASISSIAAMYIVATALSTVVAAQIAAPPYAPTEGAAAIDVTAAPIHPPATVHGKEGYVLQTRVKVGDLVRIRSGGPLMTVRAIEGSDVICQWQTWAGEPRSDRFPVAEVAPIAGPGYALSPLKEPQRYHPCKSAVATNGHNECIN
jgi:uncharacterized protein YodC (DUF2158 family)